MSNLFWTGMETLPQCLKKNSEFGLCGNGLICYETNRKRC